MAITIIGADISSYCIVPVNLHSFSSITLRVSLVNVHEWLACVLFIDTDKIQRKTRLLVWIVACHDILQHIMISWFSVQCYSSCIRKGKSILDRQSVCYFKNDGHNCAFCTWEKHMLSNTAQNGKLHTVNIPYCQHFDNC